MAEVVEIGKVAETWIYPVKSMQGLQVPEVTVRSVSVVGDRRIGFQRSDLKREFGWLSAKDLPELILYRPYFVVPSKLSTSEIVVETPDEEYLPVDSMALIAELSTKIGKSVSLVRMGRGAYDSMPVSISTLASIDEIRQELRGYVPPERFAERFRENILIESISGRPYEEQNWLGKLLFFGDRQDAARLIAVKPDGRCNMVNLDPRTAREHPEVLRHINSGYGNNMGIYCSPIMANEGRVRVGDKVYISDSLGN